MRDLEIEDLLGREEVRTDLEAVRSLVSGRRVLVTGAGGSIGSEIALQVAALEPAELLLLDHDETHLYDVVQALDNRPGPAADEYVTTLLADIRERQLVLRLLRDHRPDVVFHAAAHKHVPMLEAHPAEAVRTNVLGTANLLDACRAVDVPNFVFISTDKAVRPSSVMGASKHLAEQLVLASGREVGGAYCAVRFGNVLGSRGSVIPTFMRQIRAGGPVTVTDARMTRFFMSTREAVQLVLQAAAMAQRGEVFMLEMGEPVEILDLAKRMIRMAGRRVGEDIEVRVIGARPGEKIEEQLWLPDEAPEPTRHPAVVRLHPRLAPDQTLDRAKTVLSRLAEAGEDERVRSALFEIASDAEAWSAGSTVVAHVIDVRDSTTERSLR
jgi:FlaA1/EpsC-like NDP-sugar epimerase